MQLLAGVTILFLALSILNNLWLTSRLGELAQPYMRSGDQVWWYSSRFGLIGAGVVLILIAQRRAPASRWLALAWLLGMACILLWVTPPLPDFAKASAGQLTAYFVAQLLSTGSFIVLIFFVAFSLKVRLYFTRQAAEPARS